MVAVAKWNLFTNATWRPTCWRVLSKPAWRGRDAALSPGLRLPSPLPYAPAPLTALGVQTRLHSFINDSFVFRLKRWKKKGKRNAAVLYKIPTLAGTKYSPVTVLWQARFHCIKSPLRFSVSLMETSLCFLFFYSFFFFKSHIQIKESPMLACDKTHTHQYVSWALPQICWDASSRGCSSRQRALAAL